MGGKTRVGVFLTNWRFFLTILAPIILSLIPIYWKGKTGKEPYAAYTIMLMATYWMTESLPMAITSFFPVILFPLFGISSSDSVASAYLQDSILFLFGGCILALSFEYCNLHTRIAMKVLNIVGVKINQLLFGIMFTAMFLSMWMNNTSTTAMLIPIVLAIIEELRNKLIETEINENTIFTPVSTPPIPPNELSPIVKFSNSGNNNNNNNKNGYSDSTIKAGATKKEANTTIEERVNSLEKRIQNLKIMFLLGTAYASNIGGTGVITGSATNVIALDLIRRDADDPNTGPECSAVLQISFLDWMVFNVPPMLINTILCWLYLQIYFLGFSSIFFWRKTREGEEEDEITKLNRTLERTVKGSIKIKLEELGRITFHEIGIITLFFLMVILWIFKDPQFMPGWDALPIFSSKRGFIKESTPTLLVCLLMFVIPSKAEYYRDFRNGGLGRGLKDTLLSWDFIYEKFPWGIFVLLGGGVAMSAGSRESGLNDWIKQFLSETEFIKQMSGPLLLIFILFLTACLTSVASNTACAAIITPVLLGLSYVKNLHPLYLVLAASSVCSYAFILPVSTPPNALTYSSCPDLKLGTMMKAGSVFNVICIGILFLTTHTTSSLFFNFGSYEGQCSNMTVPAVVA